MESALQEAEVSIMGNRLGRRRRSSSIYAGTYRYTVYVKTGDRPKAGTDANIYLVLYGQDGKSKEKKLDVFFHDDFERGQLDKFKMKHQTFPTITQIELWRDTAGRNSEWFLDTILVVNEITKIQTVFPVFRWIQPNFRYTFYPMETCLPQDDTRTEQRSNELDEKRQVYELEVKVPGLPAQVKTFPADEQFPFEYSWEFATTRAKLILARKFVSVTSGKWKSIDNLKDLYNGNAYQLPSDVNRWCDDTAFGLQRIAGINNISIRLCTTIPDNLDVTQDMLNPFLEGLALPIALSDRRIFIVDHEIMADLPTAEGCNVCAPIALFFQRGDGHIVPIAIQLRQEIAEDNPVFLPSDPEYTWIMAKLWFNNADACVHQAIVHVGFTHLLAEGIAVITHRNFSQSHPVFKLLAPHFVFLFAVNSRGLEKMLSSGGWIDTTTSMGVDGLQELIRRKKTEWRMDIDGTLPADLKNRRVHFEDILPFYYFREDAIVIYQAIERYVTHYLKIYYTDEQTILADGELQTWRHEMVQSEADNGLGLNGVPGEGGKFTKLTQLVLVLTSIIYTCSVGHAAANYKQYDEYAFMPNYPPKLRGEPPTDKSELEEKDILDALPDKGDLLSVMIVTSSMSHKRTKPLGDFEMNLMFDPEALEVLKEFKEDLKSISASIKSKNRGRHPKYSYLDPEEVPNSISI